jgi:hypothetical protein
MYGFQLDFCRATVHDHVVDRGPYVHWGSLCALTAQKVNKGIGDREQVWDFHFGSCAPCGPPPCASCVRVTVVVDKSLRVVHCLPYVPLPCLGLQEANGCGILCCPSIPDEDKDFALVGIRCCLEGVERSQCVNHGDWSWSPIIVMYTRSCV